ncbi:hypothetical protein SCARD494_01054 [Seiridium cardinale]
MDVPPPIPPRPPGYELRTPANPPLPPRPSPQQGQRPKQSFPPPPPLQRPQPQAYQGAYGGPPPVHSPRPPLPPSPSRPNQWSALHHPDGVATPLFEQLMAIVFTYLDPQRTGYIRPEVLSNFLDLSGFTLEHNICNIIFSPGDIADAELKWACEAWRFDHKANSPIKFQERKLPTYANATTGRHPLPRPRAVALRRDASALAARLHRHDGCRARRGARARPPRPQRRALPLPDLAAPGALAPRVPAGGDAGPDPEARRGGHGAGQEGRQGDAGGEPGEDENTGGGEATT